MTELQLAHLSFGGESRDRNREHLLALREARIANEHRAGMTTGTHAVAGRAGIASLPGLASRLRNALAGGPALTDERACCAV